MRRPLQNVYLHRIAHHHHHSDEKNSLSRAAAAQLTNDDRKSTVKCYPFVTFECVVVVQIKCNVFVCLSLSWFFLHPSPPSSRVLLWEVLSVLSDSLFIFNYYIEGMLYGEKWEGLNTSLITKNQVCQPFDFCCPQRNRQCVAKCVCVCSLSIF